MPSNNRLATRGWQAGPLLAGPLQAGRLLAGPLLAGTLLAILALATFLRFDGLAEPSLWLDEILHVEATEEAASQPWQTWWTGVSADRENGSLYYATQLLAQTFFDGEFGVRLAPALAGLATVAALFFVALAATGSRRVAGVAAALLAVAPLHVYYSREGRPYAAVMLIAVLLMLVAVQAHRRRATELPELPEPPEPSLPRRRIPGPWVLAAYALCLSTAYWGAVTAPILVAFGGVAVLEWLLRRDRRGLSAHFALAAGSGLALSLLLFPTAEKLGGAVGSLNQTARWEITNPLTATALDRLLASMTVSGLDRGTSTALSVVLLLLALWGSVRAFRRHSRFAPWLVGLCVFPIAGWLVVLVAFDHWYNVRYTSVGLPAFLLLVALGIVGLFESLERALPRLGLPKLSSALASVLLALALLPLLLPLARTARVEPLDKPDWRGVAQLIGTLALPGEPVIARGPWAETCIGHYLKQLQLPQEVIPVRYDPGLATEQTQLHPRAWVLAAGHRQSPEFDAWASGFDPVLRLPKAKIRLSFYPDFPTLVAGEGRLDKLLAAAQQGPAAQERAEPAHRQELTESEFLLGGGWSYPEREPEGRTFRWAQRQGAEMLLLPPAGEVPTQIRLRALPFPSPNQPPQTLTLTASSDSVESSPLGMYTLESRWNDLTIPLPESLQAAESPLILSVDFGWLQSPRDLDPSSGDPRYLGAAFDFVELSSDPLPPALAPSVANPAEVPAGEADSTTDLQPEPNQTEPEPTEPEPTEPS
ncbi:MAG: glycosyltransferase family 39 protein [Acidobacteriota bacterium]